ncbi:hypothetical protein LTR37_010851 [Vermiconidia calcicola]|uniref:Uncharacterized protein n=1 Tax=Vermiconidia calcicola TaxID=1690605 RepID=A0ACC3N3P0_9PEZI|nr:hypothetical protein LTR37_010851 [Vermiconidia calcicola]
MDQANGAPPEDPLAGVPELRSYVTDDEQEKIEALKLVADSVAQMRQLANSSLIFHPLNVAMFGIVIAVVSRYLYDRKFAPFIIMMTCLGLCTTLLLLFRYVTQGYLTAAEQINWQWLGSADVIVTKFGDEIIGTVMIDWISGEPRQKRKKAWRGEIKSWAVRLKYREKGVGTALLEDAVKESRRKGAETVEFADNHANSMRILPSYYNAKFEKREKRARELLQDLLEASPTRARRKKGGSGSSR